MPHVYPLPQFENTYFSSHVGTLECVLKPVRIIYVLMFLLRYIFFPEKSSGISLEIESILKSWSRALGREGAPFHPGPAGCDLKNHPTSLKPLPTTPSTQWRTKHSAMEKSHRSRGTSPLSAPTCLGTHPIVRPDPTALRQLTWAFTPGNLGAWAPSGESSLAGEDL